MAAPVRYCAAFLGIAAALAVCCAVPVGADGVPKTMNYQGYLTDFNNSPRQGTFKMEFGLFADSTGGTATWTETYAKQHMELIEKYLKVRMANLCPVELYFRHVLARQAHDTSGRLNDIKVPTLIFVGDDDHFVVSDMSHRAGADILAKEIPNSKLVVLPGERHSYFYTEPEKVHGIMRDFLKSK